MKLSRKKAIVLCIELWTWLAKTGKKKEDWPDWDKHDTDIYLYCWFCEYDRQQTRKRKTRNQNCRYCPLVKNLGIACDYGLGYENVSFYSKWADVKTTKARKKYAKLFLKQIKRKLNNMLCGGPPSSF